MGILLSCDQKILALTVVVTFFASFFLNNSAVKAGQKDSKEGTPLHVTSDVMIAENNTSVVVFSGNVVAKKDNDIINADSIKVFFSEKKSSEEKKEETDAAKIEKMVATGNVRYTSGERRAFADKAVYTAADQVLVLTGGLPKVKTGDSYVTGKKITLYRSEDKVIVEGGPGKQVNALFNPEDKDF